MSAAKNMILSGGARAKNIVWQVAGFADFGTTSHGEGGVLSKIAVKLHTGAPSPSREGSERRDRAGAGSVALRRGVGFAL